MERYLNFGERTAMQDMAEQRIMAEYWIKDYFLSQSLGVAVEGLVIGNYSISIYTGIRAQVAFMGLQKEEFDYNMSQTYKGLAYMNSRGAKAWYTDPSETINLFKSKNDVYNRYSNSIPIRSGDNIFFVTGHGNLPGFAQDGSGEGFEDFYADDPRDVKAFDFLLASKNRAYKKAIEKNDPFISCLLVCQSELMAQGLSLLHNNANLYGCKRICDVWNR
ncbi:hypothetical protein [Edaphocola aurantiacus]|uniref:hypothetical protein n=1 Tax=Edaphocola aurantiacus TaxID=2601682 RepID=UPI001C97CA18|nr:hypothetical protein [Edaphocola aurantiacus]